MPNWCNNYLSISHDDPQMVTKACDALRAGKLFETFVPFPTDIGWDYGWCVERWGTKWDATHIDAWQDATNATLMFDTAWGPPTAFYEAIEKLGFEVDATYHESGMAFAGHYYDGDDYQYQYDFSNEDWRDDIDDEDVLEMLEEEYSNWLEWQEQEDEDEES